MTDRDLLEAAARAAGLAVYFDGEEACGRWKRSSGVGRIFWNPLVEDGDAMRLAVKLRIDFNLDTDVGFTNGYVQASFSNKGFCEDYGLDPYAATRRAIVRAAAAMDAGGSVGAA